MSRLHTESPAPLPLRLSTCTRRKTKLSADSKILNILHDKGEMKTSTRLWKKSLTRPLQIVADLVLEAERRVDLPFRELLLQPIARNFAQGLSEANTKTVPSTFNSLESMNRLRSRETQRRDRRKRPGEMKREKIRWGMKIILTLLDAEDVLVILPLAGRRWTPFVVPMGARLERR